MQQPQTFGTVEFTVTIQVTGVIDGRNERSRLKKVFEKSLNSVQLNLASNRDGILQLDATLEVKGDKLLEFGYN
jgi:hypothetical protein